MSTVADLGSALLPSAAAIELDDAIGGFVVSGILVVIGGLLMKQAFDLRRQRQLIEETPTEEVESLSIGPSEVKGKAIPAEDPLPAPFSDEECVIAEWNVEEYYEDDDSEGWRTVASGIECTPFYVDDGTGRVLVVPDEDVVYEIDREAEPRFEVGVYQRPPDAVEEFFDRRGFGPLESLRSRLNLGRHFEFYLGGGGFTFSTGSRRRGDRRYYQNLIRPGEDVYVFGTVQIRDGARSSRNPENLVIRRVPSGDEDLQPLFMIADRPEAWLQKSRRWALLRFPAGALLATAGLGGVLLVVDAAFGIGLDLF